MSGLFSEQVQSGKPQKLVSPWMNGPGLAIAARSSYWQSLEKRMTLRLGWVRPVKSGSMSGVSW